MVFNRRWDRLDQHVDDIVAYLYHLKSEAKTNIASGVAVTAKSMDGLFESDFELFESENAGIRALRGWIDGTIRQVVSIANGSKVKPDDLQVTFTEAWSHISNDGGYHDAHYHSDCSWCGIFYVRAAQCHATDETGAGNGISRFYSPRGTGGTVSDIGNAYLSHNRMDFTPSDGMLVVFPSYLLHSGLPYRGDEDRILIAFNTQTHMK